MSHSETIPSITSSAASLNMPNTSEQARSIQHEINEAKAAVFRELQLVGIKIYKDILNSDAIPQGDKLEQADLPELVSFSPNVSALGLEVEAQSLLVNREWNQDQADEKLTDIRYSSHQTFIRLLQSWGIDSSKAKLTALQYLGPEKPDFLNEVQQQALGIITKLREAVISSCTEKNIAVKYDFFD